MPSKPTYQELEEKIKALEKAVKDCQVLAGMGIDITQVKQMQEALRQSQERLKAIFEATPDPIVLYDKHGYPQYMNPAFTKVLGWTLDELKNKHIPFVPEDQKELTAQQIEKIYQTGEVARFETKRLTKSGQTLDIAITAAIITDDQNNHVGMVVNLTDITERKKLEFQFQQAQRMESLGTLAGGIAHDFNNLLMGIKGNAALLLTNKTESHPDYEKLTKIDQYTQHGADMTKQLLGFARRGKYEVTPINLNELIKSENQMFGRTKKEISIRGKYQKDLWAVEVDQGQIEQVLLNLYVNAWQAMPEGGTIQVQTENTVYEERELRPFNVTPGKYVKFSVTDTGIGMDAETRQRIFEPFFTTKEIGRGTGLGLASVYGIVKNHGGFIDVFSEPSKGATFNIYLPASEKQVTSHVNAIQPLYKGNARILLVDDEDMLLDVGQQLLEKIGFEVMTADNGQKAIEIFKKEHKTIDLVILDMIMPELGGGETFDQLRKINPQVKVLLASGYSLSGQARDILKRGCHGFIQKPFNIYELSQKIKEILS